MKHEYSDLFQPYFVKTIKEYRAKLQYTQEQMAEQLHIAPRSCGAIENCEYSVSASTLIMLFLLMAEEEVLAFLREIRECIKRTEEKSQEAS